ncbi:MAG: hypothetical protein PSU94_06325 [Lacunisphaera sp.]|nr:hypothetical protein [Lacunisphaera sp.]
MHELRHTDTNAADDSAGRAFGLEGNLYLPVVLAIFGALGLFALLTFVLHANILASGLLVALPLGAVLGWAVCLRHGKPAGHDRDWLEARLGGTHFTRVETEQRRIA